MMIYQIFDLTLLPEGQSFKVEAQASDFVVWEYGFSHACIRRHPKPDGFDRVTLPGLELQITGPFADGVVVFDVIKGQAAQTDIIDLVFSEGPLQFDIHMGLRLVAFVFSQTSRQDSLENIFHEYIFLISGVMSVVIRLPPNENRVEKKGMIVP
jgi:hypothetical protein